MLTEFFEIERGLAAAGIPLPARHRDIHPLARRAVLRATVSPRGTVTRVGVIPAADATRFWTLRDGNHNSFPRLPTGSSGKPQPLRPGGDPKLIKALGDERDGQELRNAFAGLLKTAPLRIERLVPWPTYRERLHERLAQLRGLLETDAKAVPILLRRVLFKEDGSNSDGSDLLKTLDSEIARAIVESPDAALVALAAQIVFVGAGEVLVDVDPLEDFPRTACDHRNTREIVQALNQAEQGGAVGLCALSGQMARLEDDKFPQADLRVIGPTYLYSKNTDIPCAVRYGRAGPEGFQVSRELLGRLQGAAETLAAQERKGRTWSRVPSEKPKQYDLLLAFIPALNDVRAAAGLAQDEAAFEELASRLLELAKGQRVGFSERATFIALRRVDPGNRKVIFTTTRAVKELAEAASGWTEGCRNTPDVRLPVPQGEGKPAEPRGPGRIAPGSLVALGREVFIRGGEERQEAPGPTFADAMHLFLGPEPVGEPVARRLLRLFLVRRGPLIVGIAHACLRGELKGFNGKATLDTISVLGVLLHHLARKKEVYMNDVAFQLGQLLAGADILHRGFCEHQRGGSIPSALLGNQAMALARRSPVAALDMLCNRWRVYAGWAEKNRNSVANPANQPPPKDKREMEDRQKHWAIFRGVRIASKLRQLARALHGGLLPERADDRFRAELLLGYIAGPPAPLSASKDTSTSETNPLQED